MITSQLIVILVTIGIAETRRHHGFDVPALCTSSLMVLTQSRIWGGSPLWKVAHRSRHLCLCRSTDQSEKQVALSTSSSHLPLRPARPKRTPMTSDSGIVSLLPISHTHMLGVCIAGITTLSFDYIDYAPCSFVLEYM